MDTARRSGKKILSVPIAFFEDSMEAFAEEARQISFYGRKPNGPLFNLTDGGKGGTGMFLSAEARQKMAEAKIGNTINVGRPRPDFREKTRKDITAFKLTGERIGSFDTARLASEATGVHWKKISEVARGRIKATKSSNGEIYHFRFGVIEEDIEPVPYRSQLSRRK